MKKELGIYVPIYIYILLLYIMRCFFFLVSCILIPRRPRRSFFPPVRRGFSHQVITRRLPFFPPSSSLSCFWLADRPWFSGMSIPRFGPQELFWPKHLGKLTYYTPKNNTHELGLLRRRRGVKKNNTGFAMRILNPGRSPPKTKSKIKPVRSR